MPPTQNNKADSNKGDGSTDDEPSFSEARAGSIDGSLEAPCPFCGEPVPKNKMYNHLPCDGGEEDVVAD